MEKELTRYINAQITLSWDTKQTMDQYKEILRDGGDEPYDEDLFYEYIASNLLEWLRYSSDKEILREIAIVNDEGEVLN
jgi:hypothetical protein